MPSAFHIENQSAADFSYALILCIFCQINFSSPGAVLIHIQLRSMEKTEFIPVPGRITYAKKEKRHSNSAPCRQASCEFFISSNFRFFFICEIR